jgi:hypothetical protein
MERQRRRIGRALALAAAMAAGTLAGALAGCANPIAAEVATLREKAVSPIISVLAGKAGLDDGGNLALGTVSTSGYRDLSLTIANQGKRDLVIDGAGISLTPASPDDAGAFTLVAAPAATVASSGSTTLEIRFSPGTAGSKSATLAIPTNDIRTPMFRCILAGTGSGISFGATTASSVDFTTANGGGVITDLGGETITERGIRWSTLQDPGLQDPAASQGKCAAAGTIAGSYSCPLTKLLPGPGITYYVWAYAIAGNGTVYSQSTTYSPVNATLPATAAVTAINAASATARCTAAADPGVTMKECGVCWSLSSGPTTAGSHLPGASGADIGLTGLSLATTYYARSYAILFSDTASVTTTVYGAERSFKTAGYAMPSGCYVFYDAGATIADAAYGDWRYLEAAPGDQGSSAWGDYSDTRVSGAIVTKTELGAGAANTDFLRSFPTTGTAAKTCYNLVLAGYSDWFLPSREELNLMLLNLKQYSLGGFQAWYYWSSSESGVSTAYNQRDYYTTNETMLKDNATRYVRAVRRSLTP